MTIGNSASIDRKLGSIFIKAVVVCLGITFIGFALTVLYHSRNTFEQELSSVANIAAATSRAALIFDDPKTGERVLGGFKAKSSIEYAALYRQNGELVSEYGQRLGQTRTDIPRHDEFSWTWSSLTVAVPVVLDNDPIGYLVLVSSLTTLYQQLGLFFLVTFLITAFAALGAFYFRIVLRKLVSEPIISLRDMALQVTLTKDFSARISNSAPDNDEISQLMRSFNNMLDQLEERNNQLIVAKNKAEEADRLKSIFLATVSHELRTPLHAILGITNELQDTSMSFEQQELLAIVNTSGRLLISIINDILDFSKIEAGKLVLAPIQVDLQSHLQRVVGMFEVAARKKEIQLLIVLEPQVPRTIEVDGGRLTQVLVNLVGNALKFTESGSITLHVNRTESVTRKGYMMLGFSVIDTGIGIEQSSLATIFDPFTQVQRSGEQGEGTGLGLAISSKLVSLMGGAIWAESRRGAGSKFNFTVEVKSLEGEKRDFIPPGVHSEEGDSVRLTVAKEQPPPAPNQFSVLVVEDNEINSLLAQRVLTKAGYRVLLAINGKEALEVLEKEVVDLVVMDLNMPVMDGVEATVQIRSREKEFGGRVAIIALTANAIDDQASICFEAGMDEFLTKPLDRGKLLATIAQLLPEKPNSEPCFAQSSQKTVVPLSYVRPRH